MEVIELDVEEKPQADFNFFVGAETGLLKGISINPKMNLAKNFSNMHSLERKHEITAMSWGNGEAQNEILLGLRGQIVRTFDPEDKVFTSSRDLTNASGKIVGIGRINESCLVTASECGVVQVWRDPQETFNVIDYEIACSGKMKTGDFKDEEAKAKHLVSLKAERSLAKMRQVPKCPGMIATGGKENDVQIWDLENTDKGPVFRGKNVPSDKLELRVPIWITDLCFPDQCSRDKLVTVTRYGHVRLYDTKGQQRRPVLNMDWPDQVLTAVSSTCYEHEIVIGTATGQIASFDIRMSHKGLHKKFRGCTGAIRSLDAHSSHNCFAAVGLDRFLRIYDLNKPKPIQKMYLKSKLNQVLMAKDFNPSEAIVMPEPGPVIKKRASKKTERSHDGVLEGVAKHEDGDEFWAKLPVLQPLSKKKGKRSANPPTKEGKTKKSKK